MAKKQTMKQLRKELKKESKDLKKFKKSKLKGISKAESKLGRMEREQFKRITKLSPKAAKMFKDAAKSAKAPMAKKVVKKTVGKVLRKLIPGVGAAAIAHDVLKGVSKATCSKRGGKWASGKCVGVKKTKFKSGSKVKDPISKR